MAVAMNQRFAPKLRLMVISLVDQKFTEEECVRFELLGGFVSREQVGHLVAKHGDAAWLQANHWCAGCNLRLKSSKSLLKQRARRAQHAEVVERASAAE